jgi:putative SNF2 domain helicase|nr:MAG TPA: Chromatin remodeling complex ATPase [Caudoviricetes sp.]
MSLFSTFKSLGNSVIGNIEVSESNKYITLHGFNGSRLVDAINKAWGTSKISNNIFHSATYIAVKFHKFFLMDIIYTLEKLIDEPKVPVSRRSLRIAVSKLKELTELRAVFQPGVDNSLIDRNAINLFKVSPLPWQSEYLDIYSDRLLKYKLKGHLLDAKPGTGKTIASLILMESLKADTIIVVSPKNAVIDVWKETLDNKYKNTPKYFHSLSGLPPTLGQHVYVIHYEYLSKFMDFLSKVNPGDLGKVSLVLDEAHNFNEITSQRTQSLIELTKKYVHYSLWMSGTPIKALGKEVIPLLHCIDPLFDEACEKSFAAVFGKNSERALDILANRIGILSHTVKKEDVVSDVKLYRYQANVTLKNGDDYTLPVIRLKMKAFIEERSKFYKENMKSFEEDYKYGIELYRNSIRNKSQEIKLLDDYLSKVHTIRKGWDPYTMKDISRYCNTFERTKIIPMLPNDIKKAFRKAKSVYKYVNLTIMGECLGSILGKARTQCNVDIASNLGTMRLIPLNYGPDLGLMTLDEILTNAKKKTIMFTSFVEVVTTLKAKLMEDQYRPAVVFGETNKDLPKIVESFDKEDAVNPLVATFQSLSTAVPLIMANTIIMLNIPFRDKDYVQAVARAHRKGQTEDVYVIDVLLDTGDVPNISTRSKDIATEAAQMVAKIMGVDIDEETLMSLTGEGYSEEGCVACGTQGSMFKESNVQVSQNLNNEDRRLPYYRTDIGPKVNEMLEMIEDDPDLDQIRSDLFSSDVTKKDTIGVEISNTDAKNPKFYQWM